MDEFDVAKFLEDESLLSELIEDIQEQLQTPFVETRLSNGFKENLSGIAKQFPSFLTNKPFF